MEGLVAYYLELGYSYAEAHQLALEDLRPEYQVNVVS
jgi:hypothetical protein